MDLLLEDVAREEFLADRPMLTSLVVQQGSRAMPGSGFSRIATELAETPIRTRAEWVRIRDEVWDFYKSSKAARPINTEIEVTAPGVAQYRRGDAREEPVGYSVAEHSVELQALEDELIARYERFIGRPLPRVRIRMTDDLEIEADAIDNENERLIEAKSSAGRGYVRMAIGQLYDYERAFSPRVNLAILLPERPASDLVELLQNLQIKVIYETSRGNFGEE
jgi:hypothetical protein